MADKITQADYLAQQRRMGYNRAKAEMQAEMQAELNKKEKM